MEDLDELIDSEIEYMFRNVRIAEQTKQKTGRMTSKKTTRKTTRRPGKRAAKKMGTKAGKKAAGKMSSLAGNMGSKVEKKAAEKIGRKAGKEAREKMSRTVGKKAAQNMTKTAGQILVENVDTIFDLTCGICDIYAGLSNITDALNHKDNDEVTAELVNYASGLQMELNDVQKDLKIMREHKCKATLKRQQEAQVSDEVKYPGLIKFALSHLKWMYVEMGSCN